MNKIHLFKWLLCVNEQYVNDTSFVVVTPNWAFCQHYIWQLVFMIQPFLFFCHREICEGKLVNLSAVDPYAFIHRAKILFTTVVFIDTLRRPPSDYQWINNADLVKRINSKQDFNSLIFNLENCLCMTALLQVELLEPFFSAENHI